MKITIEFIEHRDQRYPTPGDWFFTPSRNLCVRVSKLSDRRYMFLTAIHELVECLLCIEDGVSQERVDAFDKLWTSHLLSDGTEINEPGEDPHAPYHEQHVCAENVERIVAQAMAVHWPSYSAEVDRIWKLEG